MVIFKNYQKEKIENFIKENQDFEYRNGVIEYRLCNYSIKYPNIKGFLPNINHKLTKKHKKYIKLKENAGSTNLERPDMQTSFLEMLCSNDIL